MLLYITRTHSFLISLANKGAIRNGYILDISILLIICLLGREILMHRKGSSSTAQLTIPAYFHTYDDIISFIEDMKNT